MHGNHAKPSWAKTEIIKQLGYFPAFLIPAINSSLIYRSLAQQTLFAYINNPLPARFKEKLFVVLSRYFGISYFTICHSCTLRSLGISAAEILELEKIEYSQTEVQVAADLQILDLQWHPGKDWQNNLQLEASLLRCSSLIFLKPKRTTSLSAELKKLLGIYYHYLVVLLGYIKLCHHWLLSNPDISHQQDRRSQLHLGPLLLEEIQLAQFFTAKVKSVIQSETIPPLAKAQENSLFSPIKNNHRRSIETSIPQLQHKTLTACLANAPFPVMIHTRSGQIIYLNRNWLEATGYDASEISTISQWNQKAQVKQREIVRLRAETSEKLWKKYVAPAHQTAIETTASLQQIVNSLIDSIDLAPSRSKTKADNKPADTIRSEVTISTRSGERLFWELYSAALSFDQCESELTISIAKDITDVVHYETKLAEVEAKLRLVLEATKTGNWSWNLATNQIDICHRGRTILGLSDFDGSYASFLQTIHFNEKESVDLEAARAIQANQDLDLRYCIVKSNQEISQIRTKGKLHYNAEGQPIRLTGVVTDITAPRLEEKKIIRSSQ